MRIKMPRIFYGWIIVVAGGIIGAMNSGFYYYGFGAFFNDIIEEMGWSRAELSGAFSVARFEGGIVGPLAGYLIDRFGPRMMITLGLVVIGIGYLMISQVQSLLFFYIVFVLLLSVGTSFGTSLASMAAVSNWFIRRRGIAIGVLMAIFSIGGGLGVPLLGLLIANYGWRYTCIIIGLFFWVVGIPVAQLIYRRPEERGCQPDNAEPITAQSDASAAIHPPVEPEFTAIQALKCQAFWLLSIAFSIRHLVASAIAVHQAPFLRDRGYNAEEAATLLGATILVSAFGRLFWGWMGDRTDRRIIVALASLLMAVGVLIMPAIPDLANAPVYGFLGLVFNQADALVFGFIILFGVGYGGTIPVSIAMIADYFGRRNYATIQGTSGVVTMFGNVAGPVLAGYAFDVSGSYGLVLGIFAVVTVLGVPFLLLARRPKWDVTTTTATP